MMGDACHLLLLLMLSANAMGATASAIDKEGEDAPWPIVDDEGFPRSFQENGKWVNWWGRNRPGIAKALSFFAQRDHSNIPSSELVLNETLPVTLPYWLQPNNNLRVGRPGVRATWLGHATVLAEIDSTVVLADPIFSQRASYVQWMGPKRYRPAACTVQQLPDKLDVVIVSHTHYDHLDYNSVQQLLEKYGDRLTWVVPKGVGTWLLENFSSQLKVPNVHELVWWEETVVPGSNPEVRVALTPSNHWGRRGIFDENSALWGSFAVIGPSNRFWFGGDTAYQEKAFAQIGQRYGPFDLSAIPIGAYEPRWFMRHVHVNPEESVAIHKDLRSRRSVGIHWGTFRLTYEPYLEPRTRTREVASAEGLAEDDFQVVQIGQTVEG